MAAHAAKLEQLQEAKRQAVYKAGAAAAAAGRGGTLNDAAAEEEEEEEEEAPEAQQARALLLAAADPRIRTRPIGTFSADGDGLPPFPMMQEDSMLTKLEGFLKKRKVSHKALPLPCVSTVFLSKAVPFRAVRPARQGAGRHQWRHRLIFVRHGDAEDGRTAVGWSEATDARARVRGCPLQLPECTTAQHTRYSNKHTHTRLAGPRIAVCTAWY
eukprot:SAG22_NODE_130_length_18670_cov_12.091379_12_plen_214_part_00